MTKPRVVWDSTSRSFVDAPVEDPPLVSPEGRVFVSLATPSRLPADHGGKRRDLSQPAVSLPDLIAGFFRANQADSE